jgi:hypothetical protein
MKRNTRCTRWSLIAAVALAFAVSSTALAQDSGLGNPVSIGVVAGASIPLGGFSDVAGTGWHAGGLLQWDTPTFPIGIRGEGVYHKFADKTNGPPNQNIIVGTLNAVWMLPMTQPYTVRPYLIGGGGLYKERCDGCPPQVKFGLNGGAGISVPLSGFSTIIEARFHVVFDSEAGSSNSYFLPISVGLLFR